MMGLSVLHPGLLIAGLLCISIPILVHLLRRKHRPISWGAMRFLEQAYKKRRRLVTIEQLLLLLSRCGIIACIAGAVGSLMIGSGSGSTLPKTMVIMMDNSIHSASVLESGQPSIEHQRSRALDLLSTLDPTKGDRAALITLASPAGGEGIPATGQLGTIRSLIESIEPSDSDRDLQGAVELVPKIQEEVNEQTTAIHTAFFVSPTGWSEQTQSLDSNALAAQSIQLDSGNPGAMSNVAILDAEPLRPIVTRSQPNQDEIQGIRVTLARDDATFATNNTIRIEDARTSTTLATSTVSWNIGQQNQTQTISLNPADLNTVRSGIAIVRVYISESDANSRDNSMLVGLPVRSTISIGIIDAYDSADQSTIRPSRWLRAVLSADDELIHVQQIHAALASSRVDPTLDMLFVLAPSQVDDAGWDRITRLNTAGMPIVITPDPIAGSLKWIEKLQNVMLFENLSVRGHEPAIRLAEFLPQVASNSLLDGIVDEYTLLAPSVELTQSLSMQASDQASVLLTNAEGQPLMIASGDQDLDRGTVVLIGVAFDPQWTDLPARPLFVALIHELVRGVLSQSIRPETTIAGTFDTSSRTDTYIPINEQNPSKIDPRFAGGFIQVDQSGSAIGSLIIHPNTKHSIETSTTQSPRSTLASLFPESEIKDLSTINNLQTGSASASSEQRRSLAFLLLGIAAILAIMDFVLARLCSYRAVTHSALHEGGIA